MEKISRTTYVLVRKVFRKINRTTNAPPLYLCFEHRQVAQQSVPKLTVNSGFIPTPIAFGLINWVECGAGFYL